MSRFRTVSSSWLTVCVVTVITVPVWAQSVTTGGQRDPQSGVSKVDAFTVKQSHIGAAFLKLADIQGESTDKGHKGEIQIESWSWGETAGRSRPASGPGTLTITKTVDTSSPRLAEASKSRRRFDRMTVTLPPSRRGEQPATVTLEEVIVATIRQSSSGPTPTESVSFNYTRIK